MEKNGKNKTRRTRSRKEKEQEEGKEGLAEKKKRILQKKIGKWETGLKAESTNKTRTR